MAESPSGGTGDRGYAKRAGTAGDQGGDKESGSFGTEARARAGVFKPVLEDP